MDLGLSGRKAIVCAASKGLGKASALSLAHEGVELVINSRTAETLEATAEEISKETGVNVTPVACDITTDEGRAKVLEACADPDILINNAGGPPPGDFRNWDRDDWIKAVDANMLTAIFLIKAVVDGMMNEFGRIVNITSAAVKSPIDILASRMARVPALPVSCRYLAEDGGPQCGDQQYLTWTVRDGPLSSNIQVQADAAGKTFDKMLAIRNSQNPQAAPESRLNLAMPVPSVQREVGFIVGQNLLLDSGATTAPSD